MLTLFLTQSNKPSVVPGQNFFNSLIVREIKMTRSALFAALLALALAACGQKEEAAPVEEAPAVEEVAPAAEEAAPAAEEAAPAEEAAAEEAAPVAEEAAEEAAPAEEAAE
jgi:hypothetical protein